MRAPAGPEVRWGLPGAPSEAGASRTAPPPRDTAWTETSLSERSWLEGDTCHRPRRGTMGVGEEALVAGRSVPRRRAHPVSQLGARPGPDS